MRTGSRLRTGDKADKILSRFVPVLCRGRVRGRRRSGYSQIARSPLPPSSHSPHPALHHDPSITPSPLLFPFPFLSLLPPYPAFAFPLSSTLPSTLPSLSLLPSPLSHFYFVSSPSPPRSFLSFLTLLPLYFTFLFTSLFTCYYCSACSLKRQLFVSS